MLVLFNCKNSILNYACLVNLVANRTFTFKNQIIKKLKPDFDIG